LAGAEDGIWIGFEIRFGIAGIGAGDVEVAYGMVESRRIHQAASKIASMGYGSEGQ
jgi:hypothetical protein